MLEDASYTSAHFRAVLVNYNHRKKSSSALFNPSFPPYCPILMGRVIFNAFSFVAAHYQGEM